MADKKITQLTNITGANLVDADEFVVVDISADETKAITLGELKEAFDSGSGFVRITGDTMTGDLTVPNVIVSGNVDGRDVSADGTKLDGIEAGADVTDATNVAAAGAAMETGADFTGNVTFAGNTSYGDNDKAIFGAGSDLQIYHDSNHSRIYDNGGGELKIMSNGTAVRIQKDSGENMILANTDGAVNLYHSGYAKLATTSTGVDITGTLTSDGLTVDNISLDGNTLSTTSSFLLIQPATSLVADSPSSTVNLRTSSLDRLIVSNNGDISFYEDTGTTPKFFWDASAESLGIGTSSPGMTLDVDGSSGTNDIVRFSGPNSGGLTFRNATANEFILHTATSDALVFGTNGNTERMRIDSSGKVGIGTSSPYANLHSVGTIKVATGNAQGILALGEGNGTSVNVGLWRGAANAPTTDGNYLNLGGYEGMVFATGAASIGSQTERARLDASGNLLVGKTSTAFGTAGTVIKPTTGVTITRSAADPLALNRLSTDGEILGFYKDGTTVGSIASQSGPIAAYLGSSYATTGAGDTGIFFSPDNDHIIPVTATSSATRDNAIDLGSSSARFKDLYLSGGVYLGGTGAANHLDDYEEGTWTPTPSSGTLTTGSATYTKVGRMVYIEYNGALTGTRGSEQFRISGLPFTTAIWTAGSMYAQSYSQEGTEQLSSAFQGGATQIAFVAFGSEALGTELGNGYLVINGCYRVA